MLSKLDGQQFEELQNALMSAFRTYEQLQMLMRTQLNIPLAQIAPPGPLPNVAFQIIEWAEANDRVEDLISGAIKRVPNNPELRRFAVEVSLVSEEAPTPKGRFESIVLQNSIFEDVAKWRRQMVQAEQAVCRIEIDGQGIGTGFLVGADAVLTNCHVADEISDPKSVTIHFDYKNSENGNLVEGSIFRLADDFLIDKSDRHKLDFALLQLTAPAGDESISPDGKTRGWLLPKEYNFQINEIQIILQHPLAQTLKISAGAISQVDNRNHRVTYTANTEPGSSGSPVFSLGWDLVAIHHRGSKSGNTGIPLSPIWKQLEVNNLLGKFNGSLTPR